MRQFEHKILDVEAIILETIQATISIAWVQKQVLVLVYKAAAIASDKQASD